MEDSEEKLCHLMEKLDECIDGGMGEKKYRDNLVILR